MKGSARILLLSLIIPIISYASVFSSMGFGEYMNFGDASERGMGGVRIFLVPESHTFKATFLYDIISIKDKNYVKDEQSFYLYGVDYSLHLPNRFGITLSLSNILSPNFSIESKGNRLGGIIYDRKITGRGGIQESSVSLYNGFSHFSLGIGSLFSFGRIEEIWEINFMSSDYNNTIDTLITLFSGYGFKTQFNYRAKGMVVSLDYSKYLNSAMLAPRFSTSFLYNIDSDWKIGANLNIGMWKNIDTDLSTSTNLGLGMSHTSGSTTIRGGLFSRSWYYRNVWEVGGSAGTSFLYPDGLGELSVGVEVGRRGWEEIEELFVRFSVTLCGREIW
ncbi:MAG: hypothetical protein COX49_09100 [bacterium (Candidatus Stahlbacteria) CG23_combo_of_CG06-09_8_20_14_all_40_9]|nr:MAG: hypothetical protein COX49_09100 [bacterium (Candidatus Stahlbacteria) CG23_combo_of_CG06-09_8_20_14_all_40_9]